jgi:hypothetical protein
MPATNPMILPPLRGEPAYDRFLTRLEREARERGHTTRGRTALVELALNLLGLQWGITPPRRCAPKGTNRHGEPGPKPGNGKS